RSRVSHTFGFVDCDAAGIEQGAASYSARLTRCGQTAPRLSDVSLDRQPMNSERETHQDTMCEHEHAGGAEGREERRLPIYGPAQDRSEHHEQHHVAAAVFSHETLMRE